VTATLIVANMLAMHRHRSRA